jgi:predicted glycosyltransferase
MSRKRVFLYVQHLLGIGHLKRAVTLARALAAAGIDVTVASGGFDVPSLRVEGVQWVQLPPAGAADASFRTLVDADGRPVGEEWKLRRREALLAAWRAAEPHALVLELFPFGRRQMRFELLPLLEAASAAPRRPLVVCSVRDVLGGGQTKPERQDEMLELLERHFDHVLVHGDPALIPFERTFRYAQRIAARLHYTGYIVERNEPTDGDARAGAGEVLVSAGGGVVGRRLLETAIRARRLTTLAESTWRVLAGVQAPAADFRALAELAGVLGGDRVAVERSRGDFAVLLRNCVLSVSQGGYNTTMESLQAGARMVAVPFAGGAEIEQTLRARLLAERGLIEVVEEAVLAPETLAAAVDRAARRDRPAGGLVDLKGAERSAALLARWTAELTW